MRNTIGAIFALLISSGQAQAGEAVWKLGDICLNEAQVQVPCLSTYATIKDFQEQIAISREREEKLAQEIKVQAYMTDNLTVKVMEMTETDDCKLPSTREKVFDKDGNYVGEIIKSPCED